MRGTLAIRVKVLGESHPWTAMSYHDLGNILDVQGKHAEAEPLCRKGLGHPPQGSGADHSNTAMSRDGVAENLYAQGKYAEARAALSRSAGHQGQGTG